MQLHSIGNFNNVNSPSGELVDVGGFRLHIHRGRPVSEVTDPGRKKLPTIVIEAGCGWFSVMYSWLRRALSQRLAVVSYDRAGLGWSEDSHRPRDAEHIAGQLHTLLNNAGIDGPIILVGHSIAGLYLRVYAARYPEGIVGMVLLDPSHPRQGEVLPINGFTPGRRLHNIAMAVYTSIGMAKLQRPSWELRINYLDHLPEFSQRQLTHLFGFRQTYITPLTEFDSFDLAAAQTLRAGDLGDLPLLIITAPEPDTPGTENWDTYFAAWLGLQKDLLNLSSDSRHNIVAGAGHCRLITQRHFARRVADDILQMVFGK